MLQRHEIVVLYFQNLQLNFCSKNIMSENDNFLLCKTKLLPQIRVSSF